MEVKLGVACVVITTTQYSTPNDVFAGLRTGAQAGQIASGLGYPQLTGMSKSGDELTLTFIAREIY